MQRVRSAPKRVPILVWWICGTLGVTLIVLGISWWLVAPTNAALRNELLRTTATIVGGTALAIGLYYTYRTVQNAQENTRMLRRQQRHERFQLAVQQLASEREVGHIGAIFALEQLSTESNEFYWQCMETICGFVRHRSRNVEYDEYDYNLDPWNHRAPEDIVVAMEVLCRRPKRLAAGEKNPLNLFGAYLCGLRLEHAQLHYVDLSHAIMRDMSLRECNISGANLQGANLQGTQAYNTLFMGTDLRDSRVDNLRIDVGHAAPNPSSFWVTHNIDKESGRLNYVQGHSWHIEKDRIRDFYLWNSLWFGVDITDLHTNVPFEQALIEKDGRRKIRKQLYELP